MPGGEEDENKAQNDMGHEPEMLVAADGALRIAVQDQAREGQGQCRQPGHYGGERPLVEGFFVGFHHFSFKLERFFHADRFVPED